MSGANKFIKKTSGLLRRRDEKDFTAAAARLPSFEFSAGSTVNEAEGALESGRPIKVLIADVEPSPYQTSELNRQKLAELTENLRNNELSSPIVLRRRVDGRLELIAGRHRVAAFEALGRDEIDAVVRDLDDDQAERLVFYDNLFAPSLSDYDKYKGFAKRKSSKGLTGEQLAAEAGVSPSLVSMLMSFKDFPASVHAVLEEHPSAIGATTAAVLAPLSPGREELVGEAIRRVAAGELTQKDAVSWVRSGGAGRSVVMPIESFKIAVKAGKRKYADLVRRANRMTIAFSSEVEAMEMQEAIEALLRERAARQK